MVERAHGDGIQVSIGSPEAFEEVFWKTFEDVDNETTKKFKRYVELILIKNDRKRYLSKNNQNILRLDTISETFPNAKILIPFRNPIQHANSLLTQHIKFVTKSENDHFIADFMKWIGHTEFGPNYIPVHHKNLCFEDDLIINHWLEQWYLTYKHCFDNLKNNENVYFICYEKLCNASEYWVDVLQILNIKETYDFAFKESSKEVSLEIDNDLSNKALSLYSELSKLLP